MRIRVWLGIILLFLLPVMTYAQDQKEALVQEFYVKSGIEKQLVQFPLIIQAGFDEAVGSDPNIEKLPKNLVSTMRELILEAFAPKSLKETMLKEIREKLEVQDIKQLLAWLDSPLGKTITKVEVDASNPEAFIKMHEYAAEIKKSPPTPERLDLLKKLDATIKATEGNVQIVINTQIAIALALNATLPQEQQQPPAEVAREMEKISPQVEAQMKSEMQLFMLYTYRSLTEAEIKQYLDFLRSPVGSRYALVTMEAIKKALFDGSVKWGKAIGEAMKQMEKQAGA